MHKLQRLRSTNWIWVGDDDDVKLHWRIWLVGMRPRVCSRTRECRKCHSWASGNGCHRMLVLQRGSHITVTVSDVGIIRHSTASTHTRVTSFSRPYCHRLGRVQIFQQLAHSFNERYLRHTAQQLLLADTARVKVSEHFSHVIVPTCTRVQLLDGLGQLSAVRQQSQNVRVAVLTDQSVVKVKRYENMLHCLQQTQHTQPDYSNR